MSDVFFGKSAFSAIGVLVPAQLSQILLRITVYNFHFFLSSGPLPDATPELQRWYQHLHYGVGPIKGE
jgi:hypothetical protein